MPGRKTCVPQSHLISSTQLLAIMSDPNNPNIAIRSTPQWALMQREMFWAPNDEVFQPFNTGKLSPPVGTS
jgi:hypothetical protein